MLLLEVSTAVLEQATMGQNQGTDARPGSSPCSVPPQQCVRSEVKRYTPNSGCYKLAPALPRLVPGCIMTLKNLFAIHVGGGLFFWRENNTDVPFSCFQMYFSVVSFVFTREIQI